MADFATVDEILNSIFDRVPGLPQAIINGEVSLTIHYERSGRDDYYKEDIITPRITIGPPNRA